MEQKFLTMEIVPKNYDLEVILLYFDFSKEYSRKFKNGSLPLKKTTKIFYNFS